MAERDGGGARAAEHPSLKSAFIDQMARQERGDCNVTVGEEQRGGTCTTLQVTDDGEVESFSTCIRRNHHKRSENDGDEGGISIGSNGTVGDV